MKNYLILIILSTLVFCGCHKEKDPFTATNQNPIFKIKNQDSFSDSIKLGFSTNVTLPYVAIDESKDLEIRLINETGNALVSLGTTRLSQEYSPLVETNGLIVVTVENKGNHEFILEVIDNYGATTSLKVKIVAFENIEPVSSLIINPINRLEFELDASASFDKDKKFGGEIIKYKYEVIETGYVVESETENKIKVVLPGTGKWSIKVSVQDNNNQWSKEIVKTIDI